MRLTTRGLTLLLLTALVGWCVGALPASAHSRLLSISPQDGVSLPAPPTEIVLTFNEDVNPQFVTVRVTDTEGADVVGEDATAEGPRVTLPVSDPISAGTYKITYRVVSADSHPISGSTTFDIQGDPLASPSEGTASPSEASPTPSATASTPATTTSPAATDAAGDVDRETSDGIPAIVWVLVLIALAAVGLMLYARSRDRSEG